MVRHSPAPWGSEPTPTEKDPEFPDLEGTPFWIVETRHAGEVLALVLKTSRQEAEANAWLIAAAPELLASLRTFVAMYDGVRDAVSSEVKAKLERADTVIAKAEGRV